MRAFDKERKSRPQHGLSVGEALTTGGSDRERHGEFAQLAFQPDP